MKFITSSTVLLKQLQRLQSVLSSRPVIPILDFFLFELSADQLVVSATDLEVYMRASVEGVRTEDDGKIAVPSSLIIDYLKNLPEQPITFSIDLEKKILTASSETGNAKIACEGAEDYPKFPAVEGGTSLALPAKALSLAIANTAVAIGSDEMRPSMTGIYFQMFENELRFVSTDGNKLVMYRRSDLRAQAEDSFILPKKALNILKNILPSDDNPVQMVYNKINAHFSLPNVELVSRLIDERFPDYRTAIPKESPNKLTVDRLAFLSAIKKVSVFANKTTSQVRFKITGSSLLLQAQDLDFSNEAQETMACSFEGTDMEIGFNSRYLIDMLNVLTSDEVLLLMSEYNRAGIMRPSEDDPSEEILMLLMPIAISI